MRLLLAGTLILASNSIYALDVSFSGANHPVLVEIPDKSTGLEQVFIAFDSSTINEMRIENVSPNVAVYKYGNLGGGFSEPVQFSLQGSTVIIQSPEGDIGYIIEEEGRNTCFWLTDYKKHMLTLNSIVPSGEEDCMSTSLTLNGNGGPIYFYTIDGRQAELSRDIKIEYKNLVWDDNTDQFLQSDQIKELAHIINPVIITPPLYCNSSFVVTGDRFLEDWGMGLEIESELIYANGVNVMTSAEQTNLPEEDNDTPSNMIKTESQGMGGSAPADISFKAYTTDAVVHNEWQIAADENFEYIDYRFNEQNIEYTFNEEGNFYVRFVGSNSDGSCEAIGDTYFVSIGASDLRIPNAFTPNDDGVNDEWKVGYRSLLSFRCTIFDRYGNEIFSFNDPSQGWDGKYKGKVVKPGVYFYVIEATGADGKKYKKGGDINLITSKRSSNNSGSSAN